MLGLRQNDHERKVGMGQAGMTWQAVAGHFDVSIITISRLTIRLRQTGNTNDRPRNDRPRVTSQHQDRHLRLNHLRNRMITAEDTARRTPGLANVRISDYTVHRRLRESGLRTRGPVVESILKQRHKTARLVWARARRCWRLHTWRNTSILVMNPDFHFVLAMNVIMCTAGVVNVLRTSLCTIPTVLEAELLWSGLEFVMMVALSSNFFKNIECRKIQTMFLIFKLNFDHVFQHDNARCHVVHVCQDFLNQNHIRVPPWPVLSPNLLPIEHLWDKLGRRVRHRQNLPETLL